MTKKTKALTWTDTLAMFAGLLVAAFWLSIPFVVLLILVLLFRGI